MRARGRLGLLAGAALLQAAQAALAMPYTRADSNGDGVVDYEEAARAYPGLAQGQFRRLDMNRDGVIDRREYPQLDAIYQLLIRSQ